MSLCIGLSHLVRCEDRVNLSLVENEIVVPKIPWKKDVTRKKKREATMSI